MYTVYILKSTNKNKFYIGQTSNLDKRLAEHNAGRVKSTKAYTPYNVIYQEEYGSRSEAMKVEKKLKNLKSSVKLMQYVEKCMY
ncbi:MAG: GIY-YIG nuclease family protein [Candidatus Margulisbacteria bacterium]|nr:GIY-YIG nuclease family protein [Candidatus Margulisiibacteriota bacterium]